MQHGGKREGAGRPKSERKRERVSFYLLPETRKEVRAFVHRVKSRETLMSWRAAFIEAIKEFVDTLEVDVAELESYSSTPDRYNAEVGGYEAATSSEWWDKEEEEAVKRQTAIEYFESDTFMEYVKIPHGHRLHRYLCMDDDYKTVERLNTYAINLIKRGLV